MMLRSNSVYQFRWHIVQIFDFSLSEEDMRALKGLDRGWRSGAIDE